MQICERARYCEHNTNCSGACYFTNLDFVEDESDLVENTEYEAIGCE